MIKKFSTLFFIIFIYYQYSNAQLIWRDSINNKPSLGLYVANPNSTIDTFSMDSISSIKALSGFKKTLLSDSIITVLALGDSRIQQHTIIEPLREHLIAKYGYAGIGYYTTWDYYPRGIVSNTGTQTYEDQVNEGLYNLYGQAFKLNATTKQYNQIITNKDSSGDIRTINIIFLTQKAGGKFRLLVNNKLIDTINTFADKVEIKSYLFKSSVLLQNGVTIRTEAVEGISTLLGYDFRNGKRGILMNRCGNGTATTQELWNWNINYKAADFFSTYLKPSLIITLMGVNKNSFNNPPIFQGTFLHAVIDRFKKTNPQLSVILLGETGARISDEEENNINLSYYILASNYSDNYLFINLKDVVKDWEAFAKIPNMAWAIGDNVHWGTEGGKMAAKYIWKRMTSNSMIQSSIFPRIYKSSGVDNYFCDISKNADNTISYQNLSFIDLEVPKSNIIVKVNNKNYNHYSKNKKSYWNNKGNVIKIFDDYVNEVLINNIEIQILPF